MITCTIRKNDYGEYVVRVRINGTLFATYYASDRTDASSTAKAMQAEAELQSFSALSI